MEVILMTQPLNNKKASLSEVLTDNSNFLDSQALERMKKDLDDRGRDQRNGGDFRFATLKAILEVLENNQTRLRTIEHLLGGLNSDRTCTRH